MATRKATETSPGIFRIACVQLAAFSLDEARAAADHALEWVDRALQSQPDLILLPECAYPAYFLEPGAGTELDQRLAAMGAPPAHEFLARLAARALRHRCYIACGVPRLQEDGRLVNALVMFDRSGRLVAETAKQFLWHFDSEWFTPGNAFTVARADEVPVGLFVCADGRMPEIPRILALEGAELLLDATNWVSSGRDPSALNNAQASYMMRVRAAENRCYLAASNKVGTERDSIAYCGRSQIIGPDGTVLAMAGSVEPEVVMADLALALEGGRALALAGAASRWDPLAMRRPDTYGLLATPTTRVPTAVTASAVPTAIAGSAVPTAIAGSAVPTAVAAGAVQEAFVAVAQVPPHDRQLASLVRDLAAQRVALAILPGGSGVTPPEAAELTRTAGTALLVAHDLTEGENRYRAASLFHRGERLGEYRQNHLSPDDTAAGYSPGPGSHPVFDTPFGRVGVLLDLDGWVPEAARILALQGAELIIWSAVQGVAEVAAQVEVEAVARTRAAENRVFLAVAALAAPGGESMLVDPAGTVLARTFPGRRQAVAANLVLAEARVKTVVPGSDALADRRPDLYRTLTRTEVKR